MCNVLKWWKSLIVYLDMYDKWFVYITLSYINIGTISWSLWILGCMTRFTALLNDLVKKTVCWYSDDDNLTEASHVLRIPDGTTAPSVISCCSKIQIGLNSGAGLLLAIKRGWCRCNQPSLKECKNYYSHIRYGRETNTNSKLQRFNGPQCS